MIAARSSATQPMSTDRQIAYKQLLVSLFVDAFDDELQADRNVRIAASVLEALPPHLAAGVEQWLSTVIDQIDQIGEVA